VLESWPGSGPIWRRFLGAGHVAKLTRASPRR
jgi:hypothetical protein